MIKDSATRGVKPFCLIPNEVIDTAPDYHVIMVWAAIWRHGNGSDDGCWASINRLAKYARIGKHRTRDAIQWLKENGWLLAVERPGFTNCYRLTLEGGGIAQGDLQPLAAASARPLPMTGTPSDDGKGTPSDDGNTNNIPLTRSPNSLLSYGISDEIPTDAAANELCSPVSQEARRTRAKGPEGFERFWKMYLSAPVRAASQSKPKALAQWQKTIRTESEDKLLEALETEISHQHLAAGTFVCPLPDCFRWLRDERFTTVDDRPINSANLIPDVIR